MKTTATPPTERPSRRQFDREEALQTAMELFWRHGYEATSMAMLLKGMGLTAPSLYAAFGNKEKLFAEAVEHYAQHFGTKVIAPLSAPISAKEAIEQVLLIAATRTDAAKTPPGCFISFGAVNSADHKSAPVTLLRSMRLAMARRLRDRIQKGIDDGELPPSVDAARLGRFYYAVFGGIMLRALDGYSRSELEAVAHDSMLAWPGASGRC